MASTKACHRLPLREEFEYSSEGCESNRERGVTNTQCHKAKLIWSENSPRSYRERGVTNTHNVTRRNSSGRRTHREATANAVLQTHNVTKRNSSGRRTHREATANAASGESDSPGIRWSALAPGGFLGPGDSNRERGVTNTQCHKAKLIWSQNSPRSYRERGVTNTQCHKAKLIWSENSPRSNRERGVTNAPTDAAEWQSLLRGGQIVSSH